MPDTTDLATLLAAHGPENWSKELTTERAQALLTGNKAAELIVLAADIRSSTFLMKEAVNFQRFASVIGEFVDAVRHVSRGQRGWFDKFTGDGFLLYWTVDERPLKDYFEEVLTVATAVIGHFQEETEPDLRKNSRNFPNGVGLSIGIDAGPTHLAQIAGDLTIVGPTVVGAVRMVACARPYELLANIYLAERLLAVPDFLDEQRMQLDATCRPTKEYKDGQKVFSVKWEL